MSITEERPTARPGRTAGPSSSTAAHEAAERRSAARALLMHPMMTAVNHPEEMALVRRHQVALKAMFSTWLGYPLVVESTFARLSKAPLPAQAPTRAAVRSSGAGPLTARAYTYLALVCAGLLAPDVGEQIPLSVLVDQVRADAAGAQIAIDDSLPDRRSLVAAVEVLIDWGVLTQTDGTVAAWGERRENVLLTINRSLLPHLLSRPLQSVARPADLWEQPGAGSEQPRRDLRRKLVESPVVRREDLTDAERDVLSRERTELTRVLEESFGLTLEVRAEGALAYDVEDELTDVSFPGVGTTKQAALLLLNALADDLSASSASVADVDGRSVPGLFAPWSAVDDALDLLVSQHGRYWRSEVAADLAGLRTDVVDVLVSLSLAVVTDDGVVLHPAGARYRPEPVRAPAKTRAQRRLEDPELSEVSGAGAMLFDDPSGDPSDGASTSGDASDSEEA